MDLQEKIAARRKEIEQKKKEEEAKREEALREAALNKIEEEKNKHSKESPKGETPNEETSQKSKFTEEEINKKVDEEIKNIATSKATEAELLAWGALALLGVVLIFDDFWIGVIFILSSGAWRLWLIEKYKPIKKSKNASLIILAGLGAAIMIISFIIGNASNNQLLELEQEFKSYFIFIIGGIIFILGALPLIVNYEYPSQKKRTITFNYPEPEKEQESKPQTKQQKNRSQP